MGYKAAVNTGEGATECISRQKILTNIWRERKGADVSRTPGSRMQHALGALWPKVTFRRKWHIGVAQTPGGRMQHALGALWLKVTFRRKWHIGVAHTSARSGCLLLYPDQKDWTIKRKMYKVIWIDTITFSNGIGPCSKSSYGDGREVPCWHACTYKAWTDEIPAVVCYWNYTLVMLHICICIIEQLGAQNVIYCKSKLAIECGARIASKYYAYSFSFIGWGGLNYTYMQKNHISWPALGDLLLTKGEEMGSPRGWLHCKNRGHNGAQK